MAFPTHADADPDPTTQIPWPGSRNKRSDPDLNRSRRAPAGGEDVDHPNQDDGGSRRSQSRDRNGKKRLSTLDLFNLSISMAGAQIAWTVELGYGTPFLLSLGLSEQLTSLVWLAGPISGLIAQPVIGAISDSSTSKYRRRYWVVLSTVVLLVSTLTLAYCKDIASVFVDLFHGGAGDWDPRRAHQARRLNFSTPSRYASNTAIALAVVSFYLLDFALNALQASLRNLLLDIAPSDQLSDGNAWHSRMTQAGNIVGFGFGFFPLAKLPILRLLGGDQFRKFCVVAMIILVATVWITCFTQAEKERELTQKSKGRLRDIFNNIYTALVDLPRPIRRVCYVQIFAFMGWFPFLFYSTTYVGQVMAAEKQAEPDKDLATRTGAFAMLLYSLVAVAAGTVLPHLARRDTRLLGDVGDVDEDAELTRLRNTVRQWQAEAALKGKPLRLPVMPFLLRNIWMGAMLLFSVITFATFFVTKVWQAILAISLVGICWAVACWVPFAIIMEFLKELDEASNPEQKPRVVNRRTSHTRTASSPNLLRNALRAERQPLLRRRSFDDQTGPEIEENEAAPVAGGTILGIHNLAIVFPQFIVALVSSAIFNAVDAEVDGDPDNTNTYYGKNGVAWVLRFGGLCTLFGAVLCRMVPPTRTEKEMRRRLGEMLELRKEQHP
ncbi:MFS general substrate transporter [Artomyces pyxidatus]|uniref:MFS general substrate transporter n=1 Tax=Artomyces pyxidatus TaxID=48021 RepID=A0ACB8TJZ1_9AGAM|nr:MFS general substrate transporter [Artomyces pyxidatus]